MLEVSTVPVLETEGLERRFGGLLAVKDLTFSINKGEILGIIGPNGAGKTTVINLVAGIFPPTSGKIIFQGQEIQHLPAHAINRRGVARTFQNVRPLEDFTALENIMVGALFGQGQNLAKAREFAREICDLVSLGNFDRYIDNLTVLDLKKIEIGRALASKPDLLFLDELMAGLNADETAEMIDVVRHLQSRELTIIVVEHIMAVVRELTQRCIVLDGGAIIAEGSYDEVARQEQVIEAYLGKEA